MKLSEIQMILSAELLTNAGKMDKEIERAFSADMISDILLISKEHTLLLTGMVNVQVIKSAEICDLAAVVFVRGKRPEPEVIELAEEKGIPVLLSSLTLYESSGLLFSAGLPGISLNE